MTDIFDDIELFDGFDDFDDDGEDAEDINYRTVDICGLVLKMKSKTRRKFVIENEVGQLAALVGAPPKPSEAFKMLSVGGGFSSLAIIKYIADREGIEELYCSTFRIGRRHFDELAKLKARGKIGVAHFVTSQTQERTDEIAEYNGTRYNYYEYMIERCRAFGWELKSFDNHSKLLLMRTRENWYTVETSSNLNENPKMEQFCWENDQTLFEWYRELFGQLLGAKSGEEKK